jgi:ABC-type transporter Mla MlaB component
MARRLPFYGFGTRMLKISVIESDDEPAILLLDGQVAGPWVQLLQTMCEAQLKRYAQVTLDLKNVSFADREGIALLRSLTDRRVAILNAAPFIAGQIRNAEHGG